MKHQIHTRRCVGLLALMSGFLSACDRAPAPPPPITITLQNEGDGKAASAPPQATKLPYGAAAPMAPGTDGIKPVDMAATPERLISAAPTGAGSAASAAEVAVSATELTFLTQAFDSGMFNLRMSQMAVDRANDSTVKSYASLMLADQTALNSGLKELARQLRLPVPATLSEPRQRTLDSIARANGGEFDRLFLAAAGAGALQATVELFERTGRETRHPLVRDFVFATLPTLRADLAAAERLPGVG